MRKPARYELAIAALRIGFLLTAVAAATDWIFALGNHGARAATIVEGAVLTGLALAGVARPAVAARALTPTGRAAALAVAFAAAGAFDLGIQRDFAEVASAILFVAALVSAARWVAISLAVSVLGYVGDLALHGYSLHWMTSGAGQSQVATQLIDLVLNALLGALIIVVMRRFVAGAPATLAAARSQRLALTPALAAAVTSSRPRSLPRADPTALIAPLTPAEHRVLTLLAAGLAPKQAARELSVELSTVRSHISSSKRKTGARTLEHLVATFAEATVDG